MSVEADRTSVEQLLSDWEQAFNDNSREKILSLITEDLELIPPDQAPVQSDSARQLLAAFLEFDLTLEMPILELYVSNDWAFSRYKYKMTLMPSANGEPSILSGHGVHLMKRESGGSWKIAKVIWSEEQ